eukprot:gene27212-12855_t
MADVPIGDVLKDDQLAAFCKALPKAELHQHMSGSFRRESIKELLEMVAPELSDTNLVAAVRTSYTNGHGWDASLARFAAVKAAAANAVDRHRLLAELIEDLASGGVTYCELRIGIKPEPTKRDYLNGLLSVIAEQRIKYPDVTVKLLLSVAHHSSV